jgi:CRP-like cAMP-binding protein
MGDAALSGIRNNILSSLTSEDMQRMAPHLRETELKHHAVLHEVGRPVEQVHFVENGMISLLSVTRTESQVETAVMGFEGMCGIALFNRVPVAADVAVVQSPGFARSMDADAFRALGESCPSLTLALHRFSYALYAMASQASACNRRHPASQRLARWLLLAQDRIALDVLPLTHLFLSQMLGLRRSTVTIVAEELRAVGAIEYTRGKVRVVDRNILEKQSCDCYAAIVKAFSAAQVPARAVM